MGQPKSIARPVACGLCVGRMTSQLNLLRTVAWLIAAAAGTLALAGFLGAQVPRLDIFAAFRWHAGALLIVAASGGFWPRQALALALIAPVLILGVPIALAVRPAPATSAISPADPTSAGPPEGRADETPDVRRSLRIVSFNTWDETRNIDEIHELLRQSNDIAVLVEVSPPKIAVLDVLRPLYPYQVHCADFWPCSMALVSKIPFEAQGSVRPNPAMPATVWGRIAGDNGGLTILGVHVLRPTRSPRIHLGQMQGLAEFARTIPGALVIAGDFNTPAWAASMQGLRSRTGLQAMPRTLPTSRSFPSITFSFRLTFAWRA
jgi:endonuclease/exonuclease/phosphatase (EEP) superfamily protein YafD